MAPREAPSARVPTPPRMPEKESAAERLEKDPRPKGEAVPRKPVGASDEDKERLGAPGTDQQVDVRPKEVQ